MATFRANFLLNSFKKKFVVGGLWLQKWFDDDIWNLQNQL
jgi:hypothetical protein